MVENGTNGKSGRETISGIHKGIKAWAKLEALPFKRGIYRNCFGFKQLPTRGGQGPVLTQGMVGADTPTRIPNLAGTMTRESSSD